MEKESENAGVLMVVDTNVFVDLFRNHLPAVAFFDRTESGRILFSAVTEAELVSGTDCENKTVKLNMLHYLGGFRKAVVDNKTAVLAGDLRRMHMMDIPDAVIAATAIINQAVVVTKNVRHFSNIRGLSIQVPY